MFESSELIAKVAEIVLINLVLSGDNVALIALSIKDLPPHKAKIVNFAGISMALFLRVFFIIIVGYLFKFKWLHLNLIGGVLLLYITFDMIRQQDKITYVGRGRSDGALKALISIIISDISMSLDNVLAITSIVISDSGELTGQQMTLLLFGISVSMPIIFFGSEIMSRLISRFPMVMYVCAGLLLYTSVRMIFKEKAVYSIIDRISPVWCVIFTAVLVMIIVRDDMKVQ